jgi:hypothetical protein
MYLPHGWVAFDDRVESPSVCGDCGYVFSDMRLRDINEHGELHRPTAQR